MNPTLEDPRIARGMAAQLARRRERLDAGEQPLGWKVGFGAPAAMEKLKLAAPLVGFLTDQALVASDATFSLAGVAQGRRLHFLSRGNSGTFVAYRGLFVARLRCRHLRVTGSAVE